MTNDLRQDADLRRAATAGDIEALQNLLRDNPADIDTQDGGGYTALHRAALEGHEAAADLLIKAGAKIDLRNSAGSTPLIIAAYCGYAGVVQKLIDAGALLNLQNNNLDTALTSSGVAPNRLDIVRLLIKAGADMDILASGGRTALHIAAQKNDIAMARLLLEGGAALDKTDIRDCSAEETALQNNAGDIALLISQHRAARLEAYRRAIADIRLKEELPLLPKLQLRKKSR